MLTQNRDLSAIDEVAQPQPAPLVNPFSFYVRVFLRLAVAFVVLPLPLVFLNAEAGALCVLVGAMLGLSMLLSALITSLSGWWVSRRLKRFQGGEFLAHWTYTRDEWLAFAASEWDLRKSESRKGPRLCLLLGGFTGLVGGGSAAYALFPSVLGVILTALAGMVVLGLLGGLFGWLGACAIRFAGWRTYLRMQERVGETYIGFDAAYCGECYWSWTAMNFRLMGMELVPGSPAVLVFKLRVYMGRGNYTVYSYRTPVPQGREDEARRILHGLCSAY